MIELPKEFISRVQSDDFISTELLFALQSPTPTSIRKHPKREVFFEKMESVPWSSFGHYLMDRPAFTYDPHFHAGAYYPQEAGSMYLEQVFKGLTLPENPIVLDLCAAPGGKSTLLASMLDHKGILIANEINRSRAHILSENMSKWGYENTFVCNNNPSEFSFLEGQIDVLVIDAPCSGEGMFRKDPNSRMEWSINNTQQCALRQTQILEDVWPLIKEGGYLIYSTCTFNSNENEAQISPFLNDNSARPVELIEFVGMKKDRIKCGYYFFPNQIKSEGFYIACIQKTRPSNYKVALNHPNLKVGRPSQIAQYLIGPSEIKYWQEEDKLFATTPFAFSFYSLIKRLKLLKKGIHVANFQKKGWTPAFDLVYSLNIKWNLPIKEVDLQTAILILNGQSQLWDAPPNYYIVTYKNQAISMIKQLGRRFNNLHPLHWRIRHLPK